MVIEIIANYLLSNRKLVIPTLGAFVVKESGERIFSDLLREDDGVLTSLLRQKGLNEMEAAITLDRFVFEVRHDLEQYGYYRLGEIGTLRVEPDTKVLRLYPPVHTTQEVNHVHTPYVPQSLEPEVVEEKPEVVEEKPEVKVEPQTETPEVRPEVERPRRRVAKPRKKFDFVLAMVIAVIVVSLFIVGYGVYVALL